MAMATRMGLMIIAVLATIASASASNPRPSPSDSAAMARWVVSQNDWGVLRFYVTSLCQPLESFSLARHLVFRACVY